MHRRQHSNRPGFSLVEVVLAIGIIAIAVVALLGLFGPTVGGVKQIVDSNRALSVTDAVRQYINQDLEFSELESTLSSSDGQYLLFVWSEQEDSGFDSTNQDDTLIETFVSKNNSKRTNAIFDRNVPVTGPYEDNMHGSSYIAVLRQLQVAKSSTTAKPYDYGNTASQAYIPFLVSIYEVDRNQFLAAVPGGGNDTLLHDGNRITEYSMARLRHP
ncbi:MAG: prepilin-type N-terminal cleavage/methylation domain-containing protein [Verrucomicrobiota bacterium]